VEAPWKQPAGFDPLKTVIRRTAMPTYDYRCQACGKRFTQQASIAEREAKKPACPKCGSKNVVRSFSAVYVKTSKKS